MNDFSLFLQLFLCILLHISKSLIFEDFCLKLAPNEFCLNSSNIELDFQNFSANNKTILYLDNSNIYDFSPISILNISGNFNISSYDNSNNSKIKFSLQSCFVISSQKLFFALNNLIFSNEENDNMTLNSNFLCENSFFLLYNSQDVFISLTNVSFENISMIGETNYKAYFLKIYSSEGFNLYVKNVLFVNAYMNHFSFIEHSINASMLFTLHNFFDQKIDISNFILINVMMDKNSSLYEFFGNYNFIKIQNFLIENMVIFSIKTFIFFDNLNGLNYMMIKNLNFTNLYDKAMVLDPPFSSENGLIYFQTTDFDQFICSYCIFINISLKYYEVFHITHLDIPQFKNYSNRNKFILQNSQFLNVVLKTNSLINLLNVKTYIVFCSFENLTSSVTFTSNGRIQTNKDMNLKSCFFSLEFVDLLFYIVNDNDPLVSLTVTNCTLLNLFSKFGSFFSIEVYNFNFSFIKVKMNNSIAGTFFFDDNPMISFRSTNAVGIMKELVFCNSERNTISSILVYVHFINLTIEQSYFINNSQTQFSLINNADLKFFCSNLSIFVIKNSTFQGLIDVLKQTTIFCLNCNLSISNCQFLEIRSVDFANFIMRSSLISMENCVIICSNRDLVQVNYFLHSIASNIIINRLNYTVNVEFRSNNIINNNGILFYCEQSLFILSNSAFKDVFTNKSLISLFDSVSENLIQNVNFTYSIFNPVTKDIMIKDHLLRILNGFSHFYLNSVNLNISHINITTNFPIDFYQSQIFAKIFSIYLTENSNNLQGMGNGFVLQAEKSNILIDFAMISNTFSIRAGNMVMLSSNITISNSVFNTTFAFLYASLFFQNCFQINIINNTFINNGGFEYGTLYIIQDSDDNLSGFQNISFNIFTTTPQINYYFVNLSINPTDPNKTYLLKYFLKFVLKFYNDEIFVTLMVNNIFFGDFLKINMIKNTVTFYIPISGNLIFINSTFPSFLNISQLNVDNIKSDYTNPPVNFTAINNSFIQVLAKSSIIIITDSNFNNLHYYNSYGGALIIESDPLLVSTLIIRNCSFRNISIYVSGEAGAIYLDSIKAIIINSRFFDCFSAEFGGAFSMYNSEVNFSNIIFQNCTSKIGGAIFWSKIEPIFYFNVTFIDNFAYYGNNIATDIFQKRIFCFVNDNHVNKTFNTTKNPYPIVPEKLSKFDNSTFYSYFIRYGWQDINASTEYNICDRIQNSLMFKLPCFTKPEDITNNDTFNGTLLIATFDIYDQYVDLNLFRNLVKYNFLSYNDSVAKLNAVDFSFIDEGLIDINYFKFDFDNQQTPLTTTFADDDTIDLPKNMTYKSFFQIFNKSTNNCDKNNKSPLYPIKNLTITPPICQLGFAYYDFKCNLCYGANYSRNPNASSCTVRPKNAVYACGQSVIPKPGYWINNTLLNSNDNIILLPCPLPDICPNNNISIFQNGTSTSDDACIQFLNQTNYQIYSTSCISPYFGRECTSCRTGYTRSSTKYFCDECPSYTVFTNSLYLVILAAFYLYLVLTSRDYTSDIPFTELFKIINNFCIFYSVAFSRLTDMPEVKQLSWLLDTPLNLIRTLSTPQSSKISFSCFLQKTLPSDLSSDHNLIFYYEKILILSTPFFFFFIFFIIEYVYSKIKKKTDKKYTFWGLFKNSLFVIHFVFYNDVIKVCLTFLNYQNIYNVEVLDDEMEIGFNDEKFPYFLAVILTYMIIYGFVIPSYGFTLLYRHKKDLNNPSFKQKYGFLYVGYHYKVYYWEFIINFFKFSMLLMETNIVQIEISKYLGLENFDKTVLALIFLFIIRSVYFIIVLKWYPFKSKFLNSLEQRACFFSLLIIISMLIPKYFFLFPLKIYGSQSMYDNLKYFIQNNTIPDSTGYLPYVYLENDDYKFVKGFELGTLYLIIAFMFLLFVYIIIFILYNIFSDLYSKFRELRNDFLIWVLKFKCIKLIFRTRLFKLLKIQIELSNNVNFDNDELENIIKLNNYVRILHILNTKHMIKNFVKFIKVKAVNFSYRMFKRSLTVIKNFLLETHYVIPKIKKETLFKQRTATTQERKKEFSKNIDRNSFSIPGKKKSVRKPSDIILEKKKQEEAFEKTMRLFQSLNEEKYSKEEIEEFLKRELRIYISKLKEIDRIFKSKKIYKRLVRLNNNKEETIKMFIFLIDIMISNLKRIEKIQINSKK